MVITTPAPSVEHQAEVATHDYRRQLQHEISQDLKALSKVDVTKGLYAVFADWAVISVAIYLAIWIPHPLVFLVAMIAIATRQHALLIIMHDASHFRLVSNKTINDIISNCMLSYPMLIRTDSYRRNHLAHHQHTNTDDDPDWFRKSGHAEWKFPKTRGELLALLTRDLLGGGFISSLRAVHSLGTKKASKTGKRRGTIDLGMLAFWGIVAGVLFFTGTWTYALLLWFIPAWTILPVILRIRSIAEHFGLANQHELNASRNYHCNWIETAIFAPHNVSYHLDHHLFPSVPFYNLPQLHRRLMEQKLYAEHSHQSDGLFGMRRPSVEQDVSPTANALV
ncbi:fatty acid desaturase family protein [Rhodopirellula maiorica SM1]|uniref:Fatty acid desaturase family protein n=1 Tax=Rhodopirellula maiorica SM1 TaxID=1265738 RepID=M5RAK9_9BACT|nr:fatty acid desaturase family protein [Rhodopirellula maiorica SM1]